MSIIYKQNDANGIITEFYTRLLEFDTSLSDSNLFYVSYSIPEALTDELYQFIGETANDGRIGISPTKEIFQRNKIQALTTGVDLPDDKNSVQVIDHESSVNGYLPITVNNGRVYDSTGLKTQFYDTNLSLNDLIFKPWVRLISRNGCFDNSLFTDVQVVFLGKQVNKSGVGATYQSVIRKLYTFKDCIPVDTESADTYKYTIDSNIIDQRVQWKFNRYDVVLTNI